MSETFPRRLHRYLLIKRIGQGGMGLVYYALYEDVPGNVASAAIKIANSTETVASLQHEGKLLRKTSAPQIERLIEFRDSPAEVFLAKEFIDGVSLAELIQAVRSSQKEVPIELVLYIASEIVSGLRSLHELTDKDLGGSHQLLHGDLSPRNILVGFDGRVKLIDLGISQFAKYPFAPSEPVEWLNIRYSSPDRVLKGRLSVSDDLFALGMMILEMATGKHLWEGLTSGEIQNQIVHLQKDRIKNIASNLRSDVFKLVEKCLFTDAFAGFYEAREVEEAIRRLAPQKDCRELLSNFLSLVVKERSREASEEFKRNVTLYRDTQSREDVPTEVLPDSSSWQSKGPLGTNKEVAMKEHSRWRAPIMSIGRIFGILAIAEIALVMMALIISPQIRGAWKNSSLGMSLKYINIFALEEPYEFLQFLLQSSRTKGGAIEVGETKGSGIATIVLDVRPLPESVEVDGDQLAFHGKREIVFYLEHPVLLTLRSPRYPPLHLIVDKSVNRVVADFARGVVER